MIDETKIPMIFQITGRLVDYSAIFNLKFTTLN